MMTRFGRVVTVAAAMLCGQLAAPAFAQTPAGAQAAGVSAATADYRIGPNDLLTINVYRSPDLHTVTRVAIDGTINFPTLGLVKVADQTTRQIEEALAAGLEARGILVSPSVSVLVSEVRSKIVTVMGAVERPGEVPLDRPGMTLADVLARTGVSVGSGASVVVVLDPNTREVREKFPIGDVVTGAKGRAAVPGELLVVQAAPTIYVSGEVGRPGAYPLEPGMTLGQALAVGGGITPRGSRNRVEITRRDAGGATAKLGKVDLDTVLEAGDLVYVRTRIF